MELLVLPKAKGNSSQLGNDFLHADGIVLNVQNGAWHFCEDLQRQYFFYVKPTESKDSLKTFKLTTVPEATSDVHLRSDEGRHLIQIQHKKLNYLLQEYKQCLEPEESLLLL